MLLLVWCQGCDTGLLGTQSCCAVFTSDACLVMSKSRHEAEGHRWQIGSVIDNGRCLTRPLVCAEMLWFMDMTALWRCSDSACADM